MSNANCKISICYNYVTIRLIGTAFFIWQVTKTSNCTYSLPEYKMLLKIWLTGQGGSGGSMYNTHLLHTLDSTYWHWKGNFSDTQVIVCF